LNAERFGPETGTVVVLAHGWTERLNFWGPVIHRLVDAGLSAGVGMAPILPGLSDRPELLADVVRAARDAGATSIWTGLLNLRPGTREHFLASLARDWPQLVPRYERLYAGRAYLGKDEVEPVRREVAELRERFAIRDRRRVRILPVVEQPDSQQLDLATVGFGAALPEWRSRSA